METPVLGYGPNVGESHICRLCMKSHAYYLNVFVSSEQFKLPIGKVIEDLLMLEVAEGDTLPATVCCPCVTKLMEFREFKEMCVYSARELLRSEPFPCPVKVEIIEEDEAVEAAGSGLDDWNDEFVKGGSRQSVHSKERAGAPENDNADGSGDEDHNNDARGVVVKKEYDEGATVFIESAAVSMRDESLVDDDDVGHGADSDVAQTVVVKKEYGDGATVFIESAAVEMRDESDMVQQEERTTTHVVKRVVMDKSDSDEDYVPPGGVDPLNFGQTVDEFGGESDGSEYSTESGKKKRRNRKNASTTSRPLSKHLKCDTCGKLFGRRSHLKRHTLLHTGEKPHQCHLCGKSFAVLGYLRTHVASHAKKKPPENDAAEDTEAPSGIPTVGPAPKGTLSSTDFECHICGKLFKQRCNVKRHVLLHTGLKPHKCHVCGKAFVDVFNLREHEAIHLGLTLVPRRVPGGLIDPAELSICRSYK